MLILGPLSHMSRTTDRRGGRDDSVRAVVVDDSPFMRGLIADLLTDAGVTVVGEAGDGAEALSVVAETRPDVVTMDVEMPGMGGLEAVERLMDETPTPVLMLSAHTAAGDRARPRDVRWPRAVTDPKPELWVPCAGRAGRSANYRLGSCSRTIWRHPVRAVRAPPGR